MTDFFTMQPGETAAPLPPGPVLCTGTAGMRRIHRFFLWAYDEAPGLVRSAAAGDTARAAYVGEVLGNFDKVLHLHHEGEDQSMDPQLAERAPACALHVAQMLEQHRQVTDRLQGIEPVRLRWMETADAEAGRELAERYEDLKAVLNVHLRREVTEVMPVVDRVLTEKEMQQAGKHGIDQLDKKFLVGYLGMVLSTNPRQDQKEMFKEIPRRSALPTASWDAGCFGNSTRRSSLGARFPKHSREDPAAPHPSSASRRRAAGRNGAGGYQHHQHHVYGTRPQPL